MPVLRRLSVPTIMSISDEEYRLLRQNLFERFAGGAVAPSEAPVVPVVHPSRRSSDGGRKLPTICTRSDLHFCQASVPSSTQGRPPSQFHVNATRTPSLRTKPSMTSAVTTLLRRSNRSRSGSGPGPRDSSAASDASSVFSINSSTSNAVRPFGISRMLSRKRSVISVRTETDRSPYDASFSSRPTSAMGQSLGPDGVSRSATRSLGRLAAVTPPSSYNARLSGTETISPGLRPSSSLNMLDVDDDRHLQGAKDIRKEIEQVEAEGRRLMDAFNGLELSTLTRRQHRPVRLPSIISPPSDGSRSRDGREGTEPYTWADRKRHFRDLDALSIRSNTSAGTSLSAAKFQASNTRLRTVPGADKSVAILRKSSLSSISSRTNSVANGLSPMPPLSPSLSHLGVGSTSSVNLARSSNHLPLSALAESEIVDRRSFAESRLGIVGDPQEDADLTAMESELADIRKRRGEVTARYETRLEFLRAKLKGAELHEKLLRK